MSRTNRRKIADEVCRERRRQVRRRLLRSTGALLGLALVAAALYGLNRQLRVESWQVRVAEEYGVRLEPLIQRQMEALNGADFWSARPANVRRRLLTAIPDLADVEVRRQLPGRLEIIATGRRPIALWQQKEGKVFLVDARGTAYRQLAGNEFPDLPVLRMEGQLLPAAGQALRQLHKESPAFYRQVSEIFAGGRDWKFNFAHGQQWVLPVGRPAPQQLRKLVTLLDAPRWHGGKWRVDARIPNRWFLRPAANEGVI